MKYLTSKMKQQELEWRRTKVLELSSRGYSEREISEVIKVNDTAVHRDLAYLRKHAHENIQQHIHETVPEEYQKCMTGMKRTLKQTLEIAESAADPKTKLQAHAIAIDIYKNIMDLTTNGVIVNDALRIIQSKINVLNRVDTSSSSTSTDDEIMIEDELKGEEEKTTNGIF
jgi:hypothetical protein